VEIFGLPEHLPPDAPPEEVVRIALLLRDLGLSVSCLATYIGPYADADDAAMEVFLADLRRYCMFADLLGCRLIRQLPALGSPDQLSDEQWARAARGLARAADLAAEYDKRIVLETHDGQITEKPWATLRLIEMAGRDTIGVTFDPGNHVAHPEDYGPEAVAAYGGLIWNVHVKDTARANRACLFGDGEVDYAKVWEGLAAAGYDGPLGIETLVQPGAGMSVDEIIAHEAAAIRASVAASPLADRLV
ncbi:MAG: sugar phosphate isomerase/epimerase, partial [Armatimonadetes bacterium]|nr:sugar phosphate isomerase/epimerase [Armatimonadota bacterium]